MHSPLKPFHPEINETQIADLKQRLSLARFPDEETVGDWSQGIPLGYVRELVDYWRHDYDWQRAASTLHQWSNFITEIDDINIHVIHVRSPHTAATPLLMTHGWPGSVLEFRHVIDRLADPTRFGGRAEDAFHVVVPALPGYGFSGKPRQPGTTIGRIASYWIELMERLGYPRFLAHGGDWGSMVTQGLALADSDACRGIHITLPTVAPDPATFADPLPEEIKAREVYNFYQEWESGYAKIQSTRPQTLGYGLADSPVGQLAWIVEKYAQWTDCERDGFRHPENAISRDDLIDTVMLYWITNSGASSARLYWESFGKPDLRTIEQACGISLFPSEIFRASKRWAEKRFTNLMYFNDQIPRGGHFSALEVPELLVHEIRTWHTALGKSPLGH